MSERFTICCCLSEPWDCRKDATGFGPEHVQWLQRQVALYHPDVRFTCMTNRDVPGVDTVPIRNGWRGWWAKIELFAHFTDALYLDLDTVIVGPLTDLIEHRRDPLLALRKLSGIKDGDPKSIGSGVMRWSRDMRHITDAFAVNPDGFMQYYQHKHNWGDQGFIRDNCTSFEYVQDYYPDLVVSYKLDLLRGAVRPPYGCSIVAFHGVPRPWEVRHEWIEEL